MFIANLVVGDWDMQKVVPPFQEVIDANNQLNKAKFTNGKRISNCIVLETESGYVPVHLEKTVCTECGHSHGWCAIPDRFHVKREFLPFISNLTQLPCDNCGVILTRAVLWKDSVGT
ncbi:hypothetical protein GCM10027181_12770 [Rheinheimera gaetbuli]